MNKMLVPGRPARATRAVRIRIGPGPADFAVIARGDVVDVVATDRGIVRVRLGGGMVVSTVASAFRPTGGAS